MGCEAGLRLNLLFAICYLLLLTFVCFVPFVVSSPGFPSHSTSLRAGSAGMTKPGPVCIRVHLWFQGFDAWVESPPYALRPGNGEPGLRLGGDGDGVVRVYLCQ